MRIIALFFVVLTSQIAFAQNVTITGTAPEYKGETLELKSYSDYITYTEKVLASSKVADDGKFSFKISTSETILVFIDLGAQNGLIYIQANRNYQIVLPPKIEMTEADLLNPFFEKSDVYMGIANSTENDLSFQIRNFDEYYFRYLEHNFYNIYVAASKSKVDPKIKFIDEQFQKIKNPYFDNYKHYRYATLRYLAYLRTTESLAKEYFTGKPVQYNNVSYMEMFNQCFADYLVNFSGTPQGKRLNHDIYESKSFASMRQTLQKNTNFKNDTLAEFILLKGIYDGYYSEAFPKKIALEILKTVSKDSKLDLSKQYAKNMLSKLSKLLVGDPPPPFKLKDRNFDYFTPQHFKGKFVYLNFSSSKSYTCLKELKLLKQLKEDFPEKLEIVTIAVEDDFDKMCDFQQENDYDWTFLYYDKQDDLLNEYKVKTYPTYYLIDPEGRLVLSPAMGPQENFKPWFIKVLDARMQQEMRDKFGNE